jgi:trans-aconitate 2-methyltransferase
MPWNPDDYNKFKAERYAPFDDLVRLVKVRPGLKVIDLGSGTGELTRWLADLLPGSDVLGIDSSPDMLGKSAAYVRPGLAFRRQRIEDVAGRWDLIFSNAAIQWVADHESLIPRLASMLTSGGQLVVQTPRGNEAMELIEVAAREGPFREALGGWKQQFSRLPLHAYADLLFRAGGADLTIAEKVYPHVLPDSDAIVQWYEGSALVPYLERLAPAGLKDAFKARYGELLAQRFPGRPVFFGFHRILFAATFGGPAKAG